MPLFPIAQQTLFSHLVIPLQTSQSLQVEKMQSAVSKQLLQALVESSFLAFDRFRALAGPGVALALELLHTLAPSTCSKIFRGSLEDPGMLSKPTL